MQNTNTPKPIEQPAKQNTPSLMELHIISFVKEFRVKNNISQNELAKAIGANQGFISNVENPQHRAKYNVDHINSIALYFRVSPKDFLPQYPIKNNIQIKV